MRPEHKAIFQEVLSESCIGLFAAYGVELSPAPIGGHDAIDTLSMVGVIGFTHPQVRGSLVLASTEELLAASNPSSPSVRDWVAELTNQLLGRMKNRLLPYQVELQMSILLVLRGSQIRLVASEREQVPYVFKAGTGVIAIWLDAEAEPSFEMNLAFNPESIQTEGELLLF